jgi:transposase
LNQIFEGDLVKLILAKIVIEIPSTKNRDRAPSSPQKINDDRLGRVLDKLYLTGLEDIFLSIALKAIQKFSIGVESLHLDSSSLSVEGEYEHTLREEAKVEINSEQGEKRNPPQPIQITYGYSRDKRPDWKQFMVDLICSGDGDIPVFLRTGSGNESDQKVFPEIFKQF